MAEEANWRISPILGVPDVKAAANFYIEKLGFAFAEGAGVFEGVEPDEGGVYAIVWRGGASIHLQIRRGDIAQRERESHESDAYLFVDDPDSLHAEYAAKGVEILRPPMDQSYGLRDFTIADPFGFRIGFGSPF